MNVTKQIIEEENLKELELKDILSQERKLTNVSVLYKKIGVINGSWHCVSVEKIAIAIYKKKGMYIDYLSKNKIYQLSKLLSNNPKTEEKVMSLIKEGAGKPDLIVFPDNNNLDLFFLMEVKWHNDPIRIEQMKWFMLHPELELKILYIDIFYITKKY